MVKRKRDGYFCTISTDRYSEDQRDFLRRRTLPFLDVSGLDKPIWHLLQEAYLQGLRDATDVIHNKGKENEEIMGYSAH